MDTLAVASAPHDKDCAFSFSIFLSFHDNCKPEEEKEEERKAMSGRRRRNRVSEEDIGVIA